MLKPAVLGRAFLYREQETDGFVSRRVTSVVALLLRGSTWAPGRRWGSVSRSTPAAGNAILLRNDAVRVVVLFATGHVPLDLVEKKLVGLLGRAFIGAIVNVDIVF
jgi:hypothetical protein